MVSIPGGDLLPDAPEVDESRPYIDSVDVPGESQPGTAFQVTATIGNSSEIIAPQDGSCQSGIVGTNVAWRTPVEFVVDGEVVERKTKCLDGSSGTKSATARLSLSEPGEHVIKVRVIKAPDGTVEEETGQTVTVEESARDPSVPTPREEFTGFLEEIASALGVSAKYAAVLMALGIVLLLLPG